jgi:hypothetical protein
MQNGEVFHVKHFRVESCHIEIMRHLCHFSSFVNPMRVVIYHLCFNIDIDYPLLEFSDRQYFLHGVRDRDGGTPF